jgi:predicted TIM-barrel fold metal-dependent hydrolase
MAQSTKPKIGSVEELDTIIDADAHTIVGNDDIIPYLESEATKKALKRTPRPHADVFTFTHTGPILGGSYGRDSQLTGGQNEIQSKIQAMEDFDIDYSITIPTLRLATVNNDRYAVDLAQAYNSWFLDKANDQEGLKLVASTAAQRPEETAKEIHRIGDNDDVVGVSLSPGLWKPLGNDFYDPVFEAAQQHNLPIVVHGVQMREAGFPIQAHGAQTFSESHICSLPWAVMWGLTSIVVEGVPERFPQLDFVFQEAGISWIPWMKWRMDDHYLEFTDDMPLLEKLPSEYINESCYFTTQPLGHTTKHPEQLAQIIEIAGVDNIMYSADLPHMDFDPPEELFDRIAPHFSEDTVKDIMGERAVKVFNLN